MRASISSENRLPRSLGRYRIERLIGQGSMGRVLLAHDPVLDRSVAVKHLRDDLKLAPEVREGLLIRMRHEARAAARVMHPHLVTLHDMGEDRDLGLYLVFEYVEGPTLKQRLVDGPLPPGEGARLARELGAALTVAHDAGIVHRDIKPENIILAPSGAKIADFGIARIPDSTLTHAGGLMGTPAYSAPETFQQGAFSAESDQFSLAASMYEALSGRRAFPGDDAIAVIGKIAGDPPPRFAAELGLAPSVDDVLLRAMAKRSADRFATCCEFGATLERALTEAASLAGLREGGPSGALGGDPLPSVRAALPMPSATDELPPRERKLAHILLGAAAVAVTAVLLTRAVVRSADGVSRSGPPGAVVVGTASPALSGRALLKPRPASTRRLLRPKVGSEPHTSTGDVTIGVTEGGSAADAGTDAAAAPQPSSAASQVSSSSSAETQRVVPTVPGGDADAGTD